MLLLPVMLRNRTRAPTALPNKQSSSSTPPPPPPPPQQQPGMKANQARSIPSVFGSPSFLKSLLHQKPPNPEMATTPTSILDVKQFPPSPGAATPFLLLAERNLTIPHHPHQPHVGYCSETNTGRRVVLGSHLKIRVPPAVRGREEEEEGRNESPVVVGSYYGPGSPSVEQSFMSVCETCGRRLGPERNIYVYRGEKGFCSRGCRQMQIELDGGGEGVEESMAAEDPRRRRMV